MAIANIAIIIALAGASPCKVSHSYRVMNAIELNLRDIGII